MKSAVYFATVLNPKAFVRFHSVDPGVDYLAQAYWNHGDLLSVKVLNIDEARLDTKLVETGLVIEIPQIYQDHAHKARKSDVRDLCLSAGRIIDRYTNVIKVEPREWKGQLDKKTDHARTLKALTEDEKKLLVGLTKGDLGHILDAVGIGLKHLWRR